MEHPSKGLVHSSLIQGWQFNMYSWGISLLPNEKSKSMMIYGIKQYFPTYIGFLILDVDKNV